MARKGGGKGGGASAPGLPRLQRDLAAWGRQVSQVGPVSAAAARVVAAAAATAAPRRTGRLAGSLTVRPTGQRGAAVESSVDYAVPASEGHPFALNAARATEPAWLQLYVAWIDRATARIAGRTY